MLPIPAIYRYLIKLDIADLILVESLVVVLAFEGVVTQQKHVRNDAEAEDIDLAAVGFLELPRVLYDLRGHVAHCATSLE